MQSLFTFQPQNQLLHIEPLPISRNPMAAQFLTSAPCCCTLSVGHDFNGLQCFTAKISVHYTHYLAAVQKATTTEWLFPLPFVTPLSPHVLFPLHSARLSQVALCCFSLLSLFTRPQKLLLSFCLHRSLHNAHLGQILPLQINSIPADSS